MLKVYYIYTAAVSLLALIVFAFDKIRSKKENRSRVPEETLLVLCALGGALGGLLGMYIFHHKTNFKRKFHFAIGVWSSFIIQSAVAVISALANSGYIKL